MFDASGKVAPRPKKVRKRRRGVALGRRPRPERRGFCAHTTRDEHHRHNAVHVSMRREKLGPSLRSERVFRAILLQLARAKRRRVRVVHYSIQNDHLHLIVEGESRQQLSRHLQLLFSRIALAVNAVAQRRGRLFRDRHHREEIASPTQMRNALVYVLFNERKHHAQNGGAITERFLRELDDRSSAAWLDGRDWKEHARPSAEVVAFLRARDGDIDGHGAPRSAPQTWLVQCGWRVRGEGGPLEIQELPRFLPQRRARPRT